jgi:SecD/SecF fusion protein
VSDLRFLQELGAEFERIRGTHASGQRSGRVRRRRVHVPRLAMTGGGLGFSALVVLIVVVVGFGVRAPGGGSSASAHGVRIVFSATPVAPGSPSGPSLERAVEILRRRLGAVFPRVQVSRTGNGLAVVVPDAARADRARIVALTIPGRLEFYDWEANALTPNGKTVASQLQAQDTTATEISQGSGSVTPGSAGAGSLPLYTAVRLASQQPSAPKPSGLGRTGQAYYLFGAPGSAACATAAKDQHTVPAPGAHCMLLSAPADLTTASQQQIAQDVNSLLLPGIKAGQGERLAVPQGTAVLQAAPARAALQTSVSSPSAQFYVLKDNVALFDTVITHPVQSTDQAGDPDVKFGLTSPGAKKFRRFTVQIARRGQLVSGFGQQLNQHFAVALDNRLITVPSIDFKVYPDGVQARAGADITGGFTVQSAKDLATVLRFGPLPVTLSAR